GAHSTVRHQLNIPFNGSPYMCTLWAADLKIDGVDIEGIGSQSFGSISMNDGMVLIPLPEDKMFRIIIAENLSKDSTKQTKKTDAELSLRFFKSVTNRHFPSSTSWTFAE